MTNLVDIRNLSRSFGAASVLKGVDLHIAPGEFVALLGRSGSGKSTLLRVLAGLDEGTADRLHLPARRSVVFQEPRLMPWKTVLGNVTLGLDGKTLTERAQQTLDDVGLTHRTHAWPLTLSGGEAQRAALARALVRKPDLLLLDEPFASLDALTLLRMHSLVFNLWRKHNPAVLLVTHDVWEAIALAGRILVLCDGHFTKEIRVPVSYPRRRSDPELARIEADLLSELGVEPLTP